MYSIFGFEIPVDVIVAALVVNIILVIAGAVGFRNLALQIRDLKALIEKIKSKQSEIKGNPKS